MEATDIKSHVTIIERALTRAISLIEAPEAIEEIAAAMKLGSALKAAVEIERRLLALTQVVALQDNMRGATTAVMIHYDEIDEGAATASVGFFCPALGEPAERKIVRLVGMEMQRLLGKYLTESSEMAMLTRMTLFALHDRVTGLDRETMTALKCGDVFAMAKALGLIEDSELTSTPDDEGDDDE